MAWERYHAIETHRPFAKNAAAIDWCSKEKG